VTTDVCIPLSVSSIEDYDRFLAIKALPRYRIAGGFAYVPHEYAARIGMAARKGRMRTYSPHGELFDYQRDIAALAIRKQKFAIFADCGLGKTLMLLEFARHAAECIDDNKAILIVSPLMVVAQTIAECQKFYGSTWRHPIEQVPAAKLQQWLTSGKSRIGITNYDALTDGMKAGRLAGLVLDESSMLKSHYGKWGQACIELGRGLAWKLALTGTPAPNDRIEYANHAVFLDKYPTVNSFLARFFVNRGETQERWELKPHALEPFYRALSDWCIFLTNPATYGWSDNCENIPPIHVHIYDVALTPEQRNMLMDNTSSMFVAEAGGITSRQKLGQIAKGAYKGVSVATNKPGFIRQLVDSWPDESTIIWCIYNDEQARIAAEFPNAANVDGDTPIDERLRLIDDFKAGRRRVLISKPKVLGFGLNLQIATRQVFSGLQDSYESYYQAVKRSNRYGSTRPLNVHIPITEVERPMIETVLRKAKRVQHDAEQQETIFKKARHL
jgi:superfamily II DNA or RNA helicase